MTSNAPWSVKGIDRDARETAKAAAQREGMTLGEWLNQMIFAAGDPNAAPPAANDLEGLKARDIAMAFEHLTRRVSTAEAKSAEAVDSLARSLGGVVERLQRMERARNPGETPPDLTERIERLEEKSGDRTRIEALRALERAVSQVAQQFATAQSTSMTRLDSVERSLQTLAERFDRPAAGEVAAETVLSALEEMGARIERAERVAAQAQQLKADASNSVDPDFVQKTGLRLRILGDEIKRGGDQIKTLEGSISRLADQIDAAERRSADGVNKVAETIAELRAEVANGEDQAAARADIEAAVSEITQRTEDRITALQRSFDEMVRRLDSAARPASTAAQAPVAKPPAPAMAAPRAAAAQAPALDDDFDSVFADLEDLSEPEPPAVAAPAAEDDLDFELNETPAAPKAAYDSDTDDVLAEIREAFGIDAPSPSPAAPAFEEEPEVETESSEDEAPPVVDEAPPVASAAPAANADYLRAARQAAREAAARASEEGDAKRKLTPKQRAILAARAKRRRMEAEAAGREGVAAAAAPLVAEPAGKAAATDADKSSAKSRISAAIAKLKAGSAKPAPAVKQGPTLDEADAEEKPSGPPSIAAGAAAVVSKFRALPMSRSVLMLGAIAVLLCVALFVLTKDRLAPKAMPVGEARPVAAEPSAPIASPAQSDPAPAVRDETSATPTGDLVRPRDLYLQNITTLKSAETDAQAKAALAEIEKAAALGHPPAQLQLGELYKIGQIYQKDLASARAWFERAANGGNVLAMHRLGVMAARGEGGPVDPKLSIAWFEKAAAFGLLDSQYNLGATYHPSTERQSDGVQNAALAYYWYSVAARNGDAQAAEMAAGIAQTLPPAERAAQDERAAAWTSQPADLIANELTPAS